MPAGMPTLQGPPPMPPGVAGNVAPQAQPPSMMMLAGMGGQPGQTPNQTSGMSQISASVVRMAAEIDQAIKMLAQALPQLAPWAEKTLMELQFQVGTLLQSGQQPTNPTPSDNENFVDGSGRL